MSHTHLTATERDILANSLAAGETKKDIAARLGRDRSTIHREIRRNQTDGMYHANAAQAQAVSRPRGRPRRKLRDPILAAEIKARLRDDHSPEAIAGRLAVESDGLSICPQTIYNWIHAERAHGRKWHRYLPRRGKPYAKRVTKKPVFAGQLSIHDRPAVVESRRRLGDWEADTLEGCKGGPAVITMLERRSRFTKLALVQSKRAEEVARVFGETFGRNHRLPRRTLTVDRGGEFACGEALGRQFSEGVFAADPHSPWQKGSVEQTNGLLRRYLPKGFDRIPPGRLEYAMNRLNHRPRKCLGYRTPTEVLYGLQPP